MAKDSGASAGKTFSEDQVAALLAANGITTIGKAQYELLSHLDGTRTVNGFEHQFRGILKKSKELKARLDSGEKFTPVTPSKKRGGNSMNGDDTPTPSPSKKRAAKAMDEEEEGSPPTTFSKKVKTTPKPKVTPKPKPSKAPTMLQSALDATEQSQFPSQDFFNAAFHDDLIKSEPEWTEEV